MSEQKQEQVPVVQMTPEQMQQAIVNLQKQVEQQGNTISQLQSSNRNLGGNLKFLRDLVEECVHLTEQTSGIVVEHVTSLDSRLNEVGSIFTDKIRRQLREMNEGELVDKIEELLEKVAKVGTHEEPAEA